MKKKIWLDVKEGDEVYIVHRVELKEDKFYVEKWIYTPLTVHFSRFSKDGGKPDWECDTAGTVFIHLDNGLFYCHLRISVRSKGFEDRDDNGHCKGDTALIKIHYDDYNTTNYKKYNTAFRHNVTVYVNESDAARYCNEKNDELYNDYYLELFDEALDLPIRQNDFPGIGKNKKS